jgi:hypothetical protein
MPRPHPAREATSNGQSGHTQGCLCGYQLDTVCAPTLSQWQTVSGLVGLQSLSHTYPCKANAACINPLGACSCLYTRLGTSHSSGAKASRAHGRVITCHRPMAFTFIFPSKVEDICHAGLFCRSLQPIPCFLCSCCCWAAVTAGTSQGVGMPGGLLIRLGCATTGSREAVFIGGTSPLAIRASVHPRNQSALSK